MITPNLLTSIVDFRGFDLSMILSLRGGIHRPMGDFLESLSQTMLVGVMLVGRLGVLLLCIIIHIHIIVCMYTYV